MAAAAATAPVELWAHARLLTLDRHPESRGRRPWRWRTRRCCASGPGCATGWRRTATTSPPWPISGEAAAGWDTLDRDPGGLYRGVRLEAALRVADGRGRSLPPAETAFLDASRAERDAERRREVGRVRRLRAQLVAVAAALVVSLVVGAIAVGQRDRASDQSRLAEARELAAAANANLDVDPERSVLLALEAVERSRDRRRGPGRGALPEAVEALHTAVAASRLELRVPGLGGSVDWSPAGDTFVTEGPEDSGDVDLRDTTTGESVRRWQGHDPDVNAVAYGPDGATLLTTGDDGAARLWDPATGAQLQAVTGEPDSSVWGAVGQPRRAAVRRHLAGPGSHPGRRGRHRSCRAGGDVGVDAVGNRVQPRRLAAGGVVARLRLPARRRVRRGVGRHGARAAHAGRLPARRLEPGRYGHRRRSRGSGAALGRGQRRADASPCSGTRPTSTTSTGPPTRTPSRRPGRTGR